MKLFTIDHASKDWPLSKAEKVSALYPDTTIDCALPQNWLIAMADLSGKTGAAYNDVYDLLRGGFVWAYPSHNKCFGEPWALNVEALEYLQSVAPLYAEATPTS